MGAINIKMMRDDITNPRVTFLMAAYNGEVYIRQSVESILTQSFRDFKLLVIDDAAPDRTAEILGEFDDPRTTCIKNDNNLGLVASLNRGPDLIDTEFVVRLDCTTRLRSFSGCCYHLSSRF
jgi:glycosyltransferase involved in cell wall biosynthesis